MSHSVEVYDLPSLGVCLSLFVHIHTSFTLAVSTSFHCNLKEHMLGTHFEDTGAILSEL